MTSKIIGDDIYYNDELVARICTTGAAPSLLDAFRNSINDALCEDALDTEIKEIQVKIEAQAKGGLIRVEDLKEIFQ